MRWLDGRAKIMPAIGWPSIQADAIRDELVATGVHVQKYQIDVVAFREYSAVAPYPASYRETFGPLFPEKALEHWLSLVLLGGEMVDGMDVASCTSPFADIVQAHTGRPIYRQDLAYPSAISGWTIGGSADALPLPDRSLGAMTLHCAFEHFEGGTDTGLIHETARVLRPGGRLCILPLYLADVFANITDPTGGFGEPTWDIGAAPHEVVGWNNRFGRWYDVSRLHERVLLPARRFFEIVVYDVVGATHVDPLCYLRFALVLQRRSG